MNNQVPKTALLTGVALSVAYGCSGGDGDSATGRVIRGSSGVMTGPIELIEESVGIFVWGDSINQLCQQWSVARWNQSGWFYGGSYITSTADVYVLSAAIDPLSVVAAENFNNVSSDAVEAYEGDTVFFRGRNGFFGAWTIEIIEGDRDALLSGTWYFKAGGGGDFTSDIIEGGDSFYDSAVGVCDGF